MRDWTEWTVTATYDAVTALDGKMLAVLIDALPNGSARVSGDKLVLRATVFGPAGSAIGAVLPASVVFGEATYKAGLRRERMTALEIRASPDGYDEEIDEQSEEAEQMVLDAGDRLVDGLAQWLAFRDGASWDDAPPGARLMWRSIARHGLQYARAASGLLGVDTTTEETHNDG